MPAMLWGIPLAPKMVPALAFGFGGIFNMLQKVQMKKLEICHQKVTILVVSPFFTIRNFTFYAIFDVVEFLVNFVTC